jgi:hypothetical protein
MFATPCHARVVSEANLGRGPATCHPDPIGDSFRLGPSMNSEPKLWVIGSGHHMELCVAPGDEPAIVPDEAVAIVERNQRHGVFLAVSSGPASTPIARPVGSRWNFILVSKVAR